MRGNVKGKDLKSLFIDLSSMFRGYGRAKVIGIETAEDKLTVYADTGMYYMRSIEYSPISDTVNMIVPVVFSDITDLISAKEDVLVDITQYSVDFRTNKAQLSLTVGQSVITPYTSTRGIVTNLDFAELRRAAKIFSGTKDLFRMYNREFAVEVHGGYATMYSPTVWIRTRLNNMNCILTVDQLKSVVGFMPDYAEESAGRIEFKKENALLSMSKLTSVRGDDFGKMTAGLPLISTWDLSGILKELMTIKRVIGVANTEVSVYERGFKLKLTKGGVTLEESCGVSGSFKTSFVAMLDIFMMCIGLLGEESEIKVYAKEGLLCLKGQDISILVSV